jgi:hypothetical protein
MFLNISKSLNYSEADAERSKELVLRIEQLEKGEFPKYVVRSREIKEESWELMEEIRKYSHFVPPVMSDPQGHYTQLLAKKQGELKLKMYEATRPLIEFKEQLEEVKGELGKIINPIIKDITDTLFQLYVNKLPEYERTRQVRVEKEFRELSNDTMGDVKVPVIESNKEVIARIQEILIEARGKFLQMGPCSIEKIIRELEKLEARIEKIDVGKVSEKRVSQSTIVDIKERQAEVK